MERRALEMACEMALRADGATDAGVQKHLSKMVDRYLKMASGEVKPFFGMLTKPV